MHTIVWRVTFFVGTTTTLTGEENWFGVEEDTEESIRQQWNIQNPLRPFKNAAKVG